MFVENHLFAFRQASFAILILLNLVAISNCLSQNQQLITSGDDQVIIFDLERSRDTIPHIIWHWKASDAKDLPADYREKYFRSIDECKCVQNGSQVLVTSSSSGVALLQLKTKEVVFYATVGNAHSAELLPNKRIVVMGSTNDQGNRIELFDLGRSESPIFHDSIYSGHGVVWDDERNLLYTLGYDELRAYVLSDWDTESPTLVQRSSWTIPGESGHDLAPWPAQPNKLVLSEHHGTWLFDKDDHEFQPFGGLATVGDVKSVSVQPGSSNTAYIKAESSWWSERVYLLDPPRYFTFPGMHLYKVRWVLD